jgi:hypothetical protein
MTTPFFLHPANVEELRTIAAEVGAHLLQGPLRYPSPTGGWQLGAGDSALDLSEHLSSYRDCEITLIIAPTGQAEKPPSLCRLCGLALDAPGRCPRCGLAAKNTAAQIRRREQQHAAVIRAAKRILSEEGET